MPKFPLIRLALISLALSFTPAKIALAETIPFILLHLNDVYEITPVEGGKWGGLARIATLRQQLKAENPQTYTILAGDLFSPSALGTAKVDGDRLAGKQMVSVLNVMGLDYATLGNHEFDISQVQFLQRLQESTFEWFSGNVKDAEGKAFPGIAPYQILTIPGKEEGDVRVGLIGLTLDSNKAGYVSYSDPVATARSQVKELAGKVDVLIAVTHLALAQDQELAAAIPELDLILGGHEHENIQRGYLLVKNTSPNCPRTMTPILKADANARTVYIHRLSYDTVNRCLQIQSQLQPITAAIPDDLQTAQVVNEWQEKGFNAFRDQGFEPNEAIAVSPITLNALDAAVRTRPTNLTNLITRAMLKEDQGAEIAIFNGGMIRLDDVLSPGSITQYDVLRLLPFGGKVVSVEMTGQLLQKILAQGVNNQGTGGYLQKVGLEPKNIDAQKVYRVAIADYLLTGQETGLGFLTRDTPGLTVLKDNQDIRLILIDYLKTEKDNAFKNLDNFEVLSVPVQ